MVLRMVNWDADFSCVVDCGIVFIMAFLLYPGTLFKYHFVFCGFCVRYLSKVALLWRSNKSEFVCLPDFHTLNRLGELWSTWEILLSGKGEADI